jgi:hypothetical protein
MLPRDGYRRMEHNRPAVKREAEEGLAQQTPRAQRAAADRAGRDYLVNPISGGLWWVDYILIAAALLGVFYALWLFKDRER